MTPASIGKFTAARVGAILFSACMMGGFVWYSHVRAQPKSGLAAGEGTAQATILPGSKRANVTVTPDDVIRIREVGTIDRNLEAGEQGGAFSKSEKPMILPSSELGVFREIAGNASTSSGTGDGEMVPASVSGDLPTQPARPTLFSGSKTFAGPVVSGDHLGTITLGNGSQEASQLSLQNQIPVNQPSSPSRVMMVGSKSLPTPPFPAEALRKLTEKGELPPVQLPGVKSPDPMRNQNAPIFSSSKAAPQLATRPSPNQSPAPKSPPTVKKREAKTGQQTETDTPAPASP